MPLSPQDDIIFLMSYKGLGHALVKILQRYSTAAPFSTMFSHFCS